MPQWQSNFKMAANMAAADPENQNLVVAFVIYRSTRTLISVPIYMFSEARNLNMKSFYFYHTTMLI